MGGTFDPPHIAHLVIAEMARSGLELDRIVFIPAGDPWMKSGQTVTRAERRMDMVGLAIESNSSFSLSSIEVDRKGPSYAVDTVEQLTVEMGHNLDMFFILGWDSMADLNSWKAPYRLSKMVRFVVFPRPGVARPDAAKLEKDIPGITDRIIYMDEPHLSISSTCIRQRVKEGKSVRYLVSNTVERYIYDHKLYTA